MNPSLTLRFMINKLSFTSAPSDLCNRSTQTLPFKNIYANIPHKHVNPPCSYCFAHAYENHNGLEETMSQKRAHKNIQRHTQTIKLLHQFFTWCLWAFANSVKVILKVKQVCFHAFTERRLTI